MFLEERLSIVFRAFGLIIVSLGMAGLAILMIPVDLVTIGNCKWWNYIWQRLMDWRLEKVDDLFSDVYVLSGVDLRDKD